MAKEAPKKDPRKKAGRNFNYQKACLVLVCALLEGDKAAADKYGISLRTVKNYRDLATKDEFLAELLSKETGKLSQNHDEAVAKVNISILALLERTCRSVETADTKLLHAIFGAYKIINENQLFRQLVNERVTQTRADGEVYREVDAPTNSESNQLVAFN